MSDVPARGAGSDALAAIAVRARRSRVAHAPPRLEVLGIDECAGLNIWGYGDTMVYHGLEVSQLASVRYTTVGHRLVVAFPFDKVAAYLKAETGAEPRLKAVLDFMEKAQPATIAQYLKFAPGELYHSLIPKDTLFFLPAGFLLCEKVVNYKCTFGIRVSLITQCEQPNNCVKEIVKLLKNSTVDPDNEDVKKMTAVLAKIDADAASRAASASNTGA